MTSTMARIKVETFRGEADSEIEARCNYWESQGWTVISVSHCRTFINRAEAQSLPKTVGMEVIIVLRDRL